MPDESATPPVAACGNRTLEWRLRVKRFLPFLSTVGFAFAIVGLQLGQGILLARLLGPAGRGQYATAVLYVQMLLYIGLMGGLEVVCRYATDDSQRHALLPLRRAALRLGMVTGAVSAVLVMLLAVVAIPSEKRDLVPLAILCALSMIGQHVMLIMTAVDRGSGQFSAYNARRFLAAAAFPVLVGVAALAMPLTVPMACAMFVVASLISMAACLWGVPRPLDGDAHPPVGKLLRESRPYGVSMLITDGFERLDLLLVLWLASDTDQGYYAAMVPAVYPLTVIPNTLGIFLFNRGTRDGSRLRTRDVHRVLASSLAVQTVLTAIFMLLIGWAVRLVYGAAFSPAVVFALWLAPASAIRGILQGLDSYLKGRGRPLASVRARVVATVVMLATVALLYPFYQVTAVAMAALLGQLVCLAWVSAIVYADSRTITIADQASA
ncbi:MAG: hypothetical protein AAF958_13140 [Planctomycetota bacterium]